MRTIIAAAFATLFAFAAAAQEPGPAVGAPAPHDLNGTDSFGAERIFEDFAGPNGLVVFFNRSLDWCPFCQKQAIDVDARRAEFEERGYGVVIVTTDMVEKLAQARDRRELSVPLFADPDSEIITAFNLLDPAFPEGTRRHGLPYPATVVVSPDKTVLASLYVAEAFGEKKGYRQRITVDSVLEELDALAGS